MPRTGGQILIDQLKRHGVDRVFCVPGESYLGALDALLRRAQRDRTDRLPAGRRRRLHGRGRRQADRPARRRFVTRGPGATNASVGVHVAFQDSTPMILFVGDVAREQRDREAFQEVDFRRMFGPLAKWVTRDRRRRAHAGTRQPGLPHGDERKAGTGRPRAARGHADRRGRGADAGRDRADAGGARRGVDGSSSARCWRKPSGRS